MLALYSWNSPNAEKVHIALAELDLPCEIRPVDLGRGQQRSQEFLRLNPAGQVPVLVDDDGREPIAIFDSSAILVYLAERAGRLLPAAAPARQRALSWLMVHAASLGPVFGLFYELFTGENTAVPPVLRVLRARVQRAYAAIERGLDGDYLAGEYSIADIACYAWVREPERVGVDRLELPRVSEWLDRVAARPAVAAGIASATALSG